MKISSFFRRNKIRTRLFVVVFLALILIGLSIVMVLYESGQIGVKADTNGGNFVDIDNVVQSRTTSASACNTNDQTCSYQVSPGDIRATTLVNTINKTNLFDATEEIELCIENTTQNKLPSDVFNLGQTSQGLNGGKTTLYFEKISDNEIIVTSSYKRDQTVSSSFPVSYKSPASGSSFQGDAKILQGNMSYDFGNIVSRRKYENGKWSAISTDVTKMTASGNFDVKYEIRLNDDQNLLSKITQDSDFSFDSKSTWRFTTAGTLKGALNMSFALSPKTGTQYNILSASFCPDGCDITLTEKLDLKAQKKGLKDNIRGVIISKADHSETYTGKGAIDNVSHRIYWQDLTVKKNDNRSWSHNLTYDTNTKVAYNGSTLATSSLQPLKNLSQITNTIDKNNKVISTIPMMKKPVTQTYEAKINQTEVSENGQLTKRSGTGSFSSANSVTYSGIYDLLDPKLLIDTSSNKNYLQTRRDPFSETMIAKYAPTYFQQGSVYVPGLFTAMSSNATTTTLSTPPAKNLPANFIFMDSFSPNDPVWSKADKDVISQLKMDLKARNVNVVSYNTQTKKDMLAAYAKIPSGSWVLNAGHGLPDGLSAGKEFVTYLEIMQVLKDKQIKIDVFAADSCYAGRAPLGQTIIGALGPMFTNPSGQILQSPGSLFMNWNLATTDIVTALDQIAKKNAQASTVSPPTGGWPFKRNP